MITTKAKKFFEENFDSESFEFNLKQLVENNINEKGRFKVKQMNGVISDLYVTDKFVKILTDNGMDSVTF